MAHVAAERAPAGQLRARPQEVPALRQHGVVAAVAHEQVGQGALDGVAGIGAHGGARGGGEAGDLAPGGRVAELEAVAGGGAGPGQFGGADLQDFLVAGPGLLGAAGQAVDAEPDVGVAEERGGELGAVGRPGPRAGGGVEREGLGAAEDVAPEKGAVGGALGVPQVGAGLQQQAGLLPYAEGDVEIGGRGGGVEVGGAGEVEEYIGVEYVFGGRRIPG